jgi:hypothetical protein
VIATVATPGTVERAAQIRSEHVLPAILLLAIFLTCGLSPIQGDTWWQLRAGQDMWASRSVLLTDVYSHTAYGAFWSNHEWLAEVAFYGLYRLGGLPLLTLFAATLITAGWTFTWRMTQGASMPAFVLTLLALTASSGWWEPRPHAFSLLFIPWIVFLLQRAAIGLMPLLFLVWANTHGGVLLGLVLLAAGLSARTLADPGSWRRSALVLVGCLLAMTATPLGLDFWIEIPRSLSRISLYPLDEWAATELTDPVMLAFWGIAATYLWELAHHRRRLLRLSPSEAAVHACALVLLPGAVGAVRNVGPFLMLAVPALTYLWTSDQRLGRTADHEIRLPAVVSVAIILLAGSAVIATLTFAYRHQWARLRWTPLPAAAIEAIRECPDNLYNRYDEGGMLLWFVPGRKVFLDGRQDPFPPALVLEHIEMETGLRNYAATFARHQIGCAFLPAVSPVASELARDGWTAPYSGDGWRVYRAR